jgi:hypothetical protein
VERTGRSAIRVGSGLAAALWLVAACLPAGARAQVSPNGPELQVNSYTTGGQYLASVGSDAGGGFVVAWVSYGSAGTDSDGYSIQARHFDSRGIPLAPEFQVNSYTSSFQNFPEVAVAGQGSFVVVWTSDGSSGSDGSLTSVHGQRYDSNGTPLGSEFQVNTYTTSYQFDPSLALDGAGRFVVAWSSFGSNGSDESGSSIQGQRYSVNGSPIGGEFQVNTYVTGGQDQPAVAADSQGNFIVVWTSLGSNGNDTDSTGILAQRYDANGAAVGGEFQVNSYTTGVQEQPAVAFDGQRRFLVAWTSTNSDGTDTDRSIQAQRYDANGSPLGGQFQVNTDTPGDQYLPRVAADARGGFVVAWASPFSAGSDSSFLSIQVRQFGPDGAPLGPDFQVNTYTTNYQNFPTVSTDASGDFVVAWMGNGSSGSDSSGYSIHAQRFDDLFRDGFESGDASRWSSVTP